MEAVIGQPIFKSTMRPELIWICLAGLLLSVAILGQAVEQVHLALGTDETEMVVTWTEPGSQKHDGDAMVHYGHGSHSESKADAKVEHFKDSKATYTTYRALLTGLKPDTKYKYVVEMHKSKSKEFEFKTLPAGSEWLPRLAIYGDLGYKDDKSLPYLSKDVERDMYDVIFHIGDFAYDLHDKSGETGNKFMRSIEPVASRVPYMTCPGNHEKHGNFSHYDSRFSMIGDRHQPNHGGSIEHRINNHFWSAEIGPAHFILFNTEFYYYTEFGWEQIERQYRWLETELARANQHRDVRPWLIVMGHKPLYCLKKGDKACNLAMLERETIRQGIRMPGGDRLQFGLEELFHRHGVDIQFYGHEHYYGRLLPIYNFTKLSGHRSENPYDHADGPVHIITGSAGNKQHHPEFNENLKDWVAKHFYDYGYTRLTFVDRYHIQLQQVSDDQEGKVLDTIDIVKSSPKPHWMPQ